MFPGLESRKPFTKQREGRLGRKCQTETRQAEAPTAAHLGQARGFRQTLWKLHDSICPTVPKFNQTKATQQSREENVLTLRTLRCLWLCLFVFVFAILEGMANLISHNPNWWLGLFFP